MATVLQKSLPALLDRLGPERLVFGSGMPLKAASPALLKLELLEALPAVKERLAHRNMEQLLSPSKPSQ
jgi:predicted TIM-barrel fold metal-dependent hydrolase